MTDPNSKSEPTQLQRRKLMTAVAGGLAASVAGCSGDSGSDGEGTPGTDSGADGGSDSTAMGSDSTATAGATRTESGGRMLVSRLGDNVEKLTFNTWHPAAAFDSDNWTAEAYYNMTGGQFVDLNAKGDPTFGDGTADIQLSMRHTYPSTNNPWDAEHSIGNEHLRAAVNWAGSESGNGRTYTTGSEKVSEDTWRLNLAEGNPEANFIFGVNDEATSRRPLELHRNAMEKAQDVSSRQEAKDLVKPLLETKIPFDEAKGKIEQGAAKMESKSPQRLKLKFKPEAGGDYPWGLTYNPDVSQTFDGLLWENFPKDQVVPRMKQGDIWRASGVGWQPAGEVSDSWVNATSSNYFTGQIVFGTKGIFGENSTRGMQLRKALAYWVDHQQVLQFFKEQRRESSELPAAISLGPICSQPMIEKFIPDDLWNAMTHYGGSRAFSMDEQRQAEKARQAMEAGGFSKEGGQWLHPDTGEPLTLDVQIGAPKFGNEPKDYTPWKAQFSEFGIGSNVVTARNEEEVDAAVKQQSYDLLVATSSGVDMLASLAFKTQHGLGGPDLHSTRGYTDARNGVSTVQVPPVGEPDADPVEMNYDETVRKAVSLQSDADEYDQAIRKLTWMYNQWVPNIATFGGISPNWYNTSKAAFKHGSLEAYKEEVPEFFPGASNPSLQIKSGYLVAPDATS